MALPQAIDIRISMLRLAPQCFAFTSIIYWGEPERAPHVLEVQRGRLYTVLVTRNFTKSADFRGIAEDIRGMVQGCPRNRARLSAES